MPVYRKNWGDFIAEARELEAAIPDELGQPKKIKQSINLVIQVTQMVSRVSADAALKTSQDIKHSLPDIINNADRLNRVSGLVQTTLHEVFPDKDKLVSDIYDLCEEFTNYLTSFADAAMNVDGGARRRKGSKTHRRKGSKAITR